MEKQNIFQKFSSLITEKILSLNPSLSTDDKERILTGVEAEQRKELKNSPKIALIGTTGVGKSSTINSLFGTELSVSHFQACTSEEEKIIIQGKKGDVIIYDMPGLGEDEETDKKHVNTYNRILPQCDVILWIMVANGAGRAMTFDQQMLRDVVSKIGNNILDRLVIGVNQADLIEPMNWIENANVPSEKQKEHLNLRIEDIKDKLSRVVEDLSRDRILYYSAKKRYRLVQLFEAMMNACPEEREWVLSGRESIADYRELIDPEILALIERK